MQFYKEKTLNRDFSKKRRQKFLIFAYVVGSNLNFWILGVPIADTFFALPVPSQTVCADNMCILYLEVPVNKYYTQSSGHQFPASNHCTVISLTNVIDVDRYAGVGTDAVFLHQSNKISFG